jgi:hypothetical protein
MMYEMGFSVAEVKRLIISTLEPYYRDGNLLRATDVGLLAIQAINVGRISTDPKSEALLRRIVEVTWEAFTADEGASIKACAFWEERMLAANSEHWSLLHLEIVKDALPLDEFRVEVFRNIGGIIEACLKPVLSYTLNQLRIARRKPSSHTQIAGMKLGHVVTELYDTFGDIELVAPAPWPLKLHQWRNIAQHHSTTVRDQSIIGIYDEGNVQKEISLSRTEALAVAARIGEILRIANTARLIYMREHADAISPLLPDQGDRHETNVLRVSSAIATQGFHLEELLLQDQQVFLRIRDRTELPWIGRLAHCSQFVLFVWRTFPQSRVEIQLSSKTGAEKVRIWALGMELQQISKQDDPECSALADCVHLEILSHQAKE